METPIVPAGNVFQARPRLKKLILFLGSLAFSGALFVALDYFYTAATAKPIQNNQCRVPDSVRHHALQPNCTGVAWWGREAYEISTNSLGFRDERIRQIPLADPRPRILMLGDSFTEGLCPWPDSFVGKIAARFPQYDFLNGGIASYSPSNYLNVTRMVLAAGVEFDEVIVFIDISDAQDEAAYYRDVDGSGAVAGPVQPEWRPRVSHRIRLTNYVVEFLERNLIRHGYYHLITLDGDLFDWERSAWTYRKVSDTKPFHSGYAPLGLEAGIAKEEAKMTLLWQELERRHIPISVVVYPWPAQVVHDTADSRQVRMWSDWCAGKCKSFISLFSTFQAEKDRCPQSQPGCWYLDNFIFGDFHYSSAGNALVADAVSKSLEAAPPSKTQIASSDAPISKESKK
jgi:hypothetical protein